MKNLFDIKDVLSRIKTDNVLYKEFLHVPSMSAGIYKLDINTIDEQKPHTEDELYYILEGSAEMQVEDEIFAVNSGSFIFIEANKNHKFQNITKDLTIIVFFSPSESRNPQN